jgi:hypothetical protein
VSKASRDIAITATKPLEVYHRWRQSRSIGVQASLLVPPALVHGADATLKTATVPILPPPSSAAAMFASAQSASGGVKRRVSLSTSASASGAAAGSPVSRRGSKSALPSMPPPPPIPSLSPSQPKSAHPPPPNLKRRDSNVSLLGGLSLLPTHNESRRGSNASLQLSESSFHEACVR